MNSNEVSWVLIFTRFMIYDLKLQSYGFGRKHGAADIEHMASF